MIDVTVTLSDRLRAHWFRRLECLMPLPLARRAEMTTLLRQSCLDLYGRTPIAIHNDDLTFRFQIAAEAVRFRLQHG